MSGVSSDVRGLGGAMGVVLMMSEANSDIRGLGGAMGVVLATSEAWEVTSEDWEGQWVWF